MNKKSLIRLAIVSALIAFSPLSEASTVSITLSNGVGSQLISTATGSAKVTQIVAVSSTTNTTAFSIIDAPGLPYQYTNLAYTNIISYVTNQPGIWTNYYGVVNTNSATNWVLVDVTNSVGALTTNYPSRIAGNLPTNAVVKYDNVNYYFGSGVLLTNTGLGPVTFTITFQQ